MDGDTIFCVNLTEKHSPRGPAHLITRVNSNDFAT